MNDDLTFDPRGPVLLVGGYGTVGAELARLAAPHWPLLLAGRTVERGQRLAQETGARLVRWDLGDPKPFREAVRAVVTVVNDPDDRVLRAAVRGQVPYVDVARWTARMQRAATVAALLRPTAPVLLSSAWMGGVASLSAAALAEDLGGADTVEVAIRWDLKDRAGADSVEFMDRFGLDFEVVQGGRRHTIMPLSDTRTVRIGAVPTKVTRFDTPEQFTLPLTLGTTTATTRIGFSSASSTSALLVAKRLGFFRWGRGERFTPARRALLYAPGEGGTAQLRVDVSHRGRTLTATVTDPAGQAHLTALGGLLALQRVLGADGAPAPTGVVFPEQTPIPTKVAEQFATYGVTMDTTSARAADEALHTAGRAA
ncbi:saccharopine dehydrogenase [Streptomyces albipurpureus]|uniref:Saccharopine dehydrogenase n=1 Tax=Streptomyces albipurpureus TaxID=2897419 RepID=A0ABT0UK89_9ACTN|nr:saccharopine dehydrogenase [Streptomyces sp. CWNU-1]MCM2387803.1 saccharopine dehydrogenase [Streptomyces sp. CWNU-1]